MAASGNKWICYLLRSRRLNSSYSYVGITNNLRRRLRQHAGEIRGGAKSTRGRDMVLVGYFTGFQSTRHVRQFEYAAQKTRFSNRWFKKWESGKMAKHPASVRYRWKRGWRRRLAVMTWIAERRWLREWKSTQPPLFRLDPANETETLLSD